MAAAYPLRQGNHEREILLSCSMLQVDLEMSALQSFDLRVLRGEVVGLLRPNCEARTKALLSFLANRSWNGG